MGKIGTNGLYGQGFLFEVSLSTLKSTSFFFLTKLRLSL